MGSPLKALWFAYAKCLNFKALTYRAEFNASGVGDDRDFSLLEKSIALNERALEIAEVIKHGYRNKVVVDVLADRIASKEEDQWRKAIQDAERYLEAGGLDANREQNFRSIQGGAYEQLGDNENAFAFYRDAYEASKKGNPPENKPLIREAANNLICMVGILCLSGKTDEAEIYYNDLAARLNDLTLSDIEHQQKYLQAIHAVHPLPEQLIRN